MPFRIALPFRSTPPQPVLPTDNMPSPPPPPPPPPPLSVAKPTFWQHLYRYLRPLRVTIGMVALANFMVLAAALRFSSPPENQENFSFMDFQQIVVNGALFIACIFSSFGRSTLSSTYRVSLIFIICIMSLIYTIAMLLRIQARGGCSARYFSDLMIRCVMQYVISGLELFWTALLILDGAISFQQSRDVAWHQQQRAEEEARAIESAVHYQPDLSLDGNGVNSDFSSNGASGNANGISNRDIEDTFPSSVEMEPLPAYVPRANKDQPRIIDMANMSSSSSSEQLQQEQPEQEPPLVFDGSASTTAPNISSSLSSFPSSSTPPSSSVATSSSSPAAAATATTAPTTTTTTTTSVLTGRSGSSGSAEGAISTTTSIPTLSTVPPPFSASNVPPTYTP